MLDGRIDFNPRINEDDFRCFWSTGTAWGVYKQRVINGKLGREVEVLHGSL